MAKKARKNTRLTKAAIAIGSTLGRAEAKVRAARKAAEVSEARLLKQMKALERELKRTKDRLAKALS